MKAILYYSSASIALDDTRAWEIASVSALQNEIFDITGYLCFYNTYFFQYIEGDEKTVSKTMTLIQNDNRHNVIQTYEDRALRGRRFPHWRMRYVHFGSYPETSLEKAITAPMARTSASFGHRERWTTILNATLSQISDLHSAGECVEHIEKGSSVH